ncbi:MAG: glycosyltransferase family 2 protein [Planctomycetota bacterium]
MRSTRPTFRIVTPSYNQAEFLEQTILSVLEQPGLGTDFDLQYAVVDGGSDDGSEEIIRRYSDRLTYWCSEPDRGQSHAINKGFEKVEGDLCAYINSDDYFLPGAFRAVASHYAMNPYADLIHGICHRVDSRGAFLGEQQSNIESYSQILDLWNHWLNPGPNLNFIQPEVFWTKRFAESVGRFDESLFYTMDFDYWLRGFDAGLKATAMDRPLAAFRLHDGQKTTARDGSIRELLQTVAVHLERDDPRVRLEHREQMLRHLTLFRHMLENSQREPEKRVAALLSLAASEPKLLASKHYWKQLRRSGKRVFWKRGAA